jgi:hypothetical protein
MKKLASIVLVLLLVQGMTVNAQTKKKEQLKKEKAGERQRSLGGQRENGEGTGVPPASKPQEQEDSVNNEQQEQSANSPVIQPNKDQNLAGDGVEKEGANEQAAEKREKSNAPAVIQTTTSESGSPSILSENNGYERDGTNNVQRSSYNMAGAEVPGDMNLSDKNRGKRNVNMSKTRVKKQEEQPASIEGTTTKAAPSDEAVKQTKKNKGDQDKKSGRKNRRKKDKDSR